MRADAAQSTFKSLNSDIVYQQAQSLVLISSLAFVLGHEFGHNVLNQFDTENNYQLRRPPNPEDEAAADAYGFQIVVRAGMSPFFALGIFMLLDAFERDPGGPPFAGDHPPALCRWGRAMVAGWNGVKDDPAFWVQVRARGREEEAKKVEPAVRAIEDQLSVNCPTGVNAGNICLLVEKFLMESADAFTADRGEALKPNKWRSRSRFPNANCYQGERDQTFTFSCIINSDGKLPDVQAFYEGVKPQLGACLARHGGPGSWGVKSVLTNDGDETVNGVGYSRASATGTYEIELDTTTERDDHTSYNYLRVDYNPR
jgi:hypothetical protein